MKNPSITSEVDEVVTEGQIESLVMLVTEATRKATGASIRGLMKAGVLNKKNVECIRAKGNEVVAAITESVKQKLADMAENIRGYVKLISGATTLELEPTDGTQTIAGAEDVFTWGIDSDFRNWGCDVSSQPTQKQSVAVHEMIKDGTFAQVFNGMSNDLNSLCLTQPQIIQFVKKHHKWLHQNYWTFFLFKVGNEFFVAVVYLHSGDEPYVFVRRFSRGHVWDAVHRSRFVIPQLESLSV